MKLRFVGDIHGKSLLYYEYAEEALKNGADRVIQVGDYGVGFGQSDYWHNRISDFHQKTPKAGFIRGNHDNPDKVKEIFGWIKDGTVENDIMYVGGAWSIDHAYRTPGYDWWDTEQLSAREWETIIDIYKVTKPRIMVTHDAPIDVSYEMFIKTGLAMGGREAKQIPNETNVALQEMFEYHKPEYWIYGHWHITQKLNFRGTNFICVGQDTYEDIEL
jgi:predicted phosphodiesterase